MFPNSLCQLYRCYQYFLRIYAPYRQRDNKKDKPLHSPPTSLYLVQKCFVRQLSNFFFSVSSG